MSEYYVVEPEVAGDLGPQTVMDAAANPPVVSALDYELLYPPQDGIITACPCFVATGALRSMLEDMGATGCEWRDVALSKDCQFDDVWPEVALPQGWWLVVTGRPGIEDLGVTESGDLVVSARVWCAIAPQMGHAGVAAYDGSGARVW